MEHHSHIHHLPRRALRSLMAMESYTKATSVCLQHKHLIKIRASQINQCNYCLSMHTAEAKAHGETEERINALPYWKESVLFDKKERLILALTEYVTQINSKIDNPELFIHAANVFEKSYLVEVLMIIVTINAWNRIVRSYDGLVVALAKAELSM